MKIIAVYNRSGGVAKTTTTRDLASEFASLGHRVLVVDADPQATLTDYLGLSGKTIPHEDTFWFRMAERLEGKPVTHEVFGLRLGAASKTKTNSDQIDIGHKRDEEILRDVLLQFKDEIDIVLIDCPPGLGELTYQALAAADEILLPVQCESKSVNGLASILSEINDVNQKRRYREKLRVAGILPTMFERDAAEHRGYLQVVEDFAKHQLSCPVFPPVPRMRTISSAGAMQMPLRKFKASNPVNDLLKQVATRITGTQ